VVKPSSPAPLAYLPIESEIEVQPDELSDDSAEMEALPPPPNEPL
jgi:hypothetical protein